MLLTLLAAGCTAHWNDLVRYSGVPAPAVRSLDAAVYIAVIQGIRDPKYPFDTIGIPSAPPDSMLRRADQPAVAPSSLLGRIPKYWDDSLRGGVDAAIRDMEAHRLPDTTAFLEAAVAERLTVLSLTYEEAMTRAHPPILSLGRPGYNADSTIAVVYLDWRQWGFAHGENYVLARRPGEAWRIWWVFREYIT